MFSRCYYLNFLIHLVVTYVPVSKSVVSQAHTSWWSWGFLWSFFFWSLPSTTCLNFIFLPLYHHVYVNYLIFDRGSRQFSCSLLLSSVPPLSAFWLSWLHPLSLVIAVYGSGKESSTDGLCFWLLQRDLSILCKYLHGEIIDGPTHSRWGVALCSRLH